jgi:NAD(P)-dependent dehydrogenase (short-subunit alcohol dehydrogenase family)
MTPEAGPEVPATKTWLITGTTSGFGADLTIAALDRGDTVAATGRRIERLEYLKERYGERVRTIELDVTDPEAARAAVAETLEAFGRLDVLVNNAGYANGGSLEEMPDADFRAQIETNLFGVVNVTKAALPVLRRQRSGHILQFSSIGGRVGNTPSLGPYQTAKFAVEGYSGVLAAETKHLGVKVTIIEPGGFRTKWAGGAATATHAVAEDYRPSVGAYLDWFASYSGQEPGDPTRAAVAILRIVDSDNPPLRLLLGTDAYALAIEDGEARIAEALEWRSVSLSTDFREQGTVFEQPTDIQEK